MAAPKGKEWGGVFVALVIVCYGIMFIENVKGDSDIVEYFTDVALAFGVAGIATLAWLAWSFLRQYDAPGHDLDEEG